MVEIIPSMVAAAAALFAAFMSVWSSQHTEMNKKRSLEIEFRRQQLNDLYGPIHMKQRTSVALRGLFPWKNPDGTKWRLVDHIVEIQHQAEPTKLSAVSEIIRINEEIAELLTKHFGLYLGFPPPDTLSHYIAHAKLLSLAWREGRNEDSANRLPFPDEFDTVIEDAIDTLRNRLGQIGGLPPGMLRRTHLVSSRKSG
jgi:hypothetical protein